MRKFFKRFMAAYDECLCLLFQYIAFTLGMVYLFDDIPAWAAYMWTCVYLSLMCHAEKPFPKQQED